MSAWFEAPAHLILILAAVVSGQEPVAQLPVSATSLRATDQGPYGFSEATWLSAVKSGFGGSAVESHRSRIFITSNGRLYLPVAAERSAILGARQDEMVARAVALDLARYNFSQLRSSLGRAAGVKDLYAAHLAGLDVAVRLARLNASNPRAVVADAFPELTSTLPAVRSTITVADFYHLLPDGAVMATPTPGEPKLTGLQIAAPATEFADRFAPLRGVLKGAVTAEIASNKLALLEWTAEVRLAP